MYSKADILVLQRRNSITYSEGSLKTEILSALQTVAKIKTTKPGLARALLTVLRSIIGFQRPLAEGRAHAVIGGETHDADHLVFLKTRQRIT